MACRRRTSLIVTLIAGLAALFATGIVGIAGIGAAGAGDLTAPVRIEIEPRSRESAVGGSIDYAVTLRNAVGDPVAAPKQMTIDVETTLPSGRTETRQVVIGPGQTDAGGVVPVAEPGAIRIGVSNPELMGGGVVVFGKPGAPSRGLRLPSTIEAPAPVPAPTSTPTSTAAPTPAPTPATVPSRAPASVSTPASTPAPTAAPSVGESAPAASSSATVSAPAQPAPGGGVPSSVDTDAATVSDVPETAATPAADPEPVSSAAVVSLDPGRLPASAIGDRTLMLYVPEAEILADGSNGAEVTVYLDPCGTVPSDVVVRLAVTRGRLDPAIVRIPQGECSASTIWRSERMSLGEATLSVLVSTPNLRRGDRVVRRFVPPIHSLRLTPNPAEITLLTQGDVLAQLHDDVNDVPVPTDRPMKLTLALREGNGALRPLELVFDAGDSTARAAFRPTYWGKVVVAGQIPFRLEEHAVFEVKSGARVFILSAVGGLIGGLLAYRAKKEKPLRILIGLVTGFALFAFFLFFGAENILQVTGGLNVLNPVSVFLLSLAGGWAGTAVLAWALKRIGIEA